MTLPNIRDHAKYVHRTFLFLLISILFLCIIHSYLLRLLLQPKYTLAIVVSSAPSSWKRKTMVQEQGMFVFSVVLRAAITIYRAWRMKPRMDLNRKLGGFIVTRRSDSLKKSQTYGIIGSKKKRKLFSNMIQVFYRSHSP